VSGSRPKTAREKIGKKGQGARLHNARIRASLAPQLRNERGIREPGKEGGDGHISASAEAGRNTGSNPGSGGRMRKCFAFPKGVV